MKKYKNPEIQLLKISSIDIIRTSGETSENLFGYPEDWDQLIS